MIMKRYFQMYKTGCKFANFNILLGRFERKLTFLAQIRPFPLILVVSPAFRVKKKNKKNLNSLFPAHQSQTKYFRKTFRQMYLWPHQLQKTKRYIWRNVFLKYFVWDWWAGDKELWWKPSQDRLKVKKKKKLTVIHSIVWIEQKAGATLARPNGKINQGWCNCACVVTKCYPIERELPYNPIGQFLSSFPKKRRLKTKLNFT